MLGRQDRRSVLGGLRLVWNTRRPNLRLRFFSSFPSLCRFAAGRIWRRDDIRPAGLENEGASCKVLNKGMLSDYLWSVLFSH